MKFLRHWLLIYAYHNDLTIEDFSEFPSSSNGSDSGAAET